MLFWTIVLYVAGAFFALRSLLSLMAQHKQVYERKLRRQMQLESEQPGDSAKPASEATPARGTAAKKSAA